MGGGTKDLNDLITKCITFLLYIWFIHPKEVHTLITLCIFEVEIKSKPLNYVFTYLSIKKNAIMFQILKLTLISRTTRTQSTGR